MSTETQSETGTILVTLYATRGGKKEKITTSAKTWGELKGEVSSAGFDVKKLHATESITKSNLVNDQALIPQQNFTLFLTPKETKSGSRDASTMAYADVKKAVKADIDANPDHAKAHYGNYTQLSSAKMKELYSSYISPVLTEQPATNVADVVEAVKESKTTAVVEKTNLNRVENIEQELADILANTKTEAVRERVAVVIDEVSGLKAEILEDGDGELASLIAETPAGPTEAEIAAEEARKAAEKEAAEKRAQEEARVKADKEESDRLAKEAKEMGL